MQDSENRKRWHKRFGTPELYQQSLKGYYRLLTGLDRLIGVLISALRHSGQLDNTVIVFTADNGIFNGERGLADKQLMYEESIRVPMIVVDPRVPESARGQRLDHLALNIDLCPTLLEAAGREVPERSQGRSLLPLVSGASPSWRSDFFYEHHFANDWTPPIPASEGVRTHQWKYIRYVQREPLMEVFFDLKKDPGEVQNLLTLAEPPPQIETARERWKVWRAALQPWNEMSAPWKDPV